MKDTRRESLRRKQDRSPIRRVEKRKVERASTTDRGAPLRRLA
jgi:hypothetical protein